MRMQQPWSALKHLFSVLFLHWLLTVFQIKSKWLFFTLPWLHSPVPSYLRHLEFPEQLPHIGFGSLNHKSSRYTFSNITITDQDYSKYGFSKVSQDTTPKLQLHTTIKKKNLGLLHKQVIPLFQKVQLHQRSNWHWLWHSWSPSQS